MYSTVASLAKLPALSPKLSCLLRYFKPWTSLNRGCPAVSFSRVFSILYARHQLLSGPMFHKAVQQHDALPHQKSTSLSQRLFPSSSPTIRHDSIENTSRISPQPRQTLQSTASSVLNGKLGSRIPPKRTTSQANDTEPFSSKQPPTLRKPSSASSSQVISVKNGQSIVGRLHEGVYFDENDFVDDAELDLDEGSFVECQSTIGEIELPPVHNKNSAVSEKRAPSSSAPLEWSSSSPIHKGGQPDNASMHMRASEFTRPTMVHSRDIVPRLSKRGTLPWLVDQQSQETVKTPPAHAQKLIDRKMGQRQRPSNFPTEPFTHLPTDNSESHHPWNKTASALKEEQKNHRRQASRDKRKIDTEGRHENTAEVSRNPKKCKTIAQVFLSVEQRRILDLVAEGKKSVFFTGSAGTGKSVLLREIIKILRQKYKKELDRVAVTASTGLAACNIGGVTLHSFGGIGLGKEAVPELVKKIKRNQKAKNRWMRTKVLIVDEVSMVDGDLFDKLEGIARAIRTNGRPFGGIQLVVTGDFFQLPPVPDSGKAAKFAFDAATWNTSIDHTIGLTQVFRQKDPRMHQTIYHVSETI